MLGLAGPLVYASLLDPTAVRAEFLFKGNKVMLVIETFELC
jgi:hypothetical protein